MARATGLGGIFFRTRNPAKVSSWYKRHLGVPVEAWGGASFSWRAASGKKEEGCTIWSPFPNDTPYFGRSKQDHMVNFRVANLKRLLAQLRKEGVWVDPKTDSSEFGKFGWIKDGEGRRVELWEPPKPKKKLKK